jgi:predicted nucleotidyltransferase
MLLETISANTHQLAQLCEQNQVARLELFGSASTKRFDSASSDLVFLVEFCDQTPKGPSTRYFELRRGLEELFGRTVDLVEVQTIQNPYFLEAIAPTRQILYGN